MWNIIVVHYLEQFGTFKSIKENMKWGFGVNSHVEMNY